MFEKLRNNKIKRMRKSILDLLEVKGPSISKEQVAIMAEESHKSGVIKRDMQKPPEPEKIVKETVEAEFRNVNNKYSGELEEVKAEVTEKLPEFRSAKSIFDKNGRRMLNTMFPHGMGLAILSIMFLETPINVKVFVPLLENVKLSWWFGIGLTAGLILMADLVGTEIKRKRTRLAIGLIASILAFFVVLSIVRQDYVKYEQQIIQTLQQNQQESDKEKKVPSLLDYIPEKIVMILFWSLNVFFFSLGILVTYHSRDHDGEFEKAFKQYHKLHDELTVYYHKGEIITKTLQGTRKRFIDDYEALIAVFRHKVQLLLSSSPEYMQNGAPELNLDEVPDWDSNAVAQELKRSFQPEYKEGQPGNIPEGL